MFEYRYLFDIRIIIKYSKLPYLFFTICITACLVHFRDRFLIQHDVTFFNLLHIFRDIFSNKQNLSPCVQRFYMHTHTTIHLSFYKYSVYVKRD